LFYFYLERIPDLSLSLSLQELSAGKINRKTQQFGGELGREEAGAEEEREKPMGLLCFFLASGDIDGAALTSWARGTVAVRLFWIVFPPSSEQPCSFFFYW
jgi:hypothetical protein